ncbi:MAG: hypothetical protein AAFP03_05860, partial [Cyanobacteria bacterium J06598_3]
MLTSVVGLGVLAASGGVGSAAFAQAEGVAEETSPATYEQHRLELLEQPVFEATAVIELVARCQDPDDKTVLDSGLSLNEYRQSLVQVALIAAQQVRDPLKKGQLLQGIGSSYACLGQADQASAVLTGALEIARGLVGGVAEDLETGELLFAIAHTYGSELNDVATSDAVIAEVLAIANSNTASRETQRRLLQRIANHYAWEDRLPDAQAVIANITDPDVRARELRQLPVRIDPQLAETRQTNRRDRSQNSQSDDELAFQRRFELVQALATTDDPIEIAELQQQLDEAIALQLQAINDLPDGLARGRQYASLGRTLVSTQQPEK